MRRGLIGFVGLLAVLLPALVAAPAAADADRLGLSWDGTTWSGSLTGELLDIAGAPEIWVPGDSAVGRFYVRNQSADGAALLVEYELGANGELVGPSDLVVSARVGTGEWVPLAPAGVWLPLGDGSLGDGATTAVEMRAVFDPASTNETQTEVLPLWFRVTLAERQDGGEPGTVPPGGDGPDEPGDEPGDDPGDAPAPNPGPPPDDPGGGLPDTGTTVRPSVAVLGGVLLGVGLALVVRSRRESGRG